MVIKPTTFLCLVIYSQQQFRLFAAELYSQGIISILLEMVNHHSPVPFGNISFVYCISCDFVQIQKSAAVFINIIIGNIKPLNVQIPVDDIAK